MTPSPLAKYDALLFDFDGVLADTERVHHRAWNQTLEPLGIQLDWPAYQKNFVGVADEVALRERLQVIDQDGLVARKQALFRAGWRQRSHFFQTRSACSRSFMPRIG